MDPSTALETHHDPHAHDAGHEHHELGFWRKYIFSTDHKMIGIQYGLCGLVFLFFGFSLMMLMRWQLAYPGQALPVIGHALGHFFGAGSMPRQLASFGFGFRSSRPVSAGTAATAW